MSENYKITEFRPLPEGWRWARTGEVCEDEKIE